MLATRSLNGAQALAKSRRRPRKLAWEDVADGPWRLLSETTTYGIRTLLICFQLPTYYRSRCHSHSSRSVSYHHLPWCFRSQVPLVPISPCPRPSNEPASSHIVPYTRGTTRLGHLHLPQATHALYRPKGAKVQTFDVPFKYPHPNPNGHHLRV